MKKTVISILGTNLDRRGRNAKRWDKWRPNVSLCQQDDLIVDRLVLLYEGNFRKLAEQVKGDIGVISPETEVLLFELSFEDPWDFEAVYSSLFDFSQEYQFNPDEEEYLIHITTGTHVAQICLYLLTETHYLPGKLFQTSPGNKENPTVGKYQIIDLDLSKYDQIASRFYQESVAGVDFLKGGIETRNQKFNHLIEQLEKVSILSQEPMLITGATGAGKTQLVKRIYELKKQRGQIAGNLVVVNCATLLGDNAMSALFGHRKGAFTGAVDARNGLLKEADGGLLFLDEIAELGLDEQAMLLRAIEEKQYLPLGADKEVESDFQLVAGANKNMNRMVSEGKFREDLLARINLWSYQLPSLKDRIEDLEPNLDFELQRFSRKAGHQVSFNKAARKKYLKYATSPSAVWSANFRDLNSSVIRMATLAEGGRISELLVDDEIERLEIAWNGIGDGRNSPQRLAEKLLGEQAREFDLYEYYQLLGLYEVCSKSSSMAEAGRKLFNVSRTNKKSNNDSHRLKQLLNKFNLSFTALNEASKVSSEKNE
ncbi:sigma 54-dependent transcriptional regulator [Aliikangiella marina]|uniref:Sigma 54-dependent transcriptional regulator n=1 Tax=Aliikangiella marina TaxID=1712262 RepID=A0A545TCL1_9GAMM|nr:RNA repair transcriptional activator RtcR [Aliikangiella marina]TQV74955.1 sigma 54-dependent transcriptional regulator [Aliikangiella marina]